MPLASTFGSQWFGPAAAAVRSPGASSSVLAIKGWASGAEAATGAGAVNRLKPTRLRNRPISTTGVGAMVAATPKGRARGAMSVRVNTISQDDVTGAVLEAAVEGGLSLKGALRLILAALTGKAAGGGSGTITFRDQADTKPRLTLSVDAQGNRSAVTRDAE